MPVLPTTRQPSARSTSCYGMLQTLLGKIVIALVAVCTLVGIWYFSTNIIGQGNFNDRYAARPAAPGAAGEYIIDADTANEVDDLFAIVGALAREKIRRGGEGEGPVLAGLTAAHFHTSPLATSRSADESQTINEEIARLMGLPRLRMLVGANSPMRPDGSPRRSPAAAFIAERAGRATPENKLQVFILGPATNLASAIALEPRIAQVIHARYLGFWYDPTTGVYDKDEFNTGNDPVALNALLDNRDLEFTVMTATTSEQLQMPRGAPSTELPADHRLTNYLQDRWDSYNRWWTDEDPNKQYWTMWDVALIEAWFEPQLTTVEARPAPPDNYERDITVYVDIDEAAMLDTYWAVVREALDAPD